MTQTAIEVAHAVAPRTGQHFVRVGASGPVVVLLHGYGDSWRSFELLVPALAGRFTLLAPDHRGHGGTPAASDYTVAALAADAIAFIESAAEGKVHLVGHSLGGIVAQRVAEARPDLVDRLVLIGTARSAAGHAGLAEFRRELDGYSDAIPRDVIEAFQAGTTFAPLHPDRLRVFVDESVKLDLGTWRGAASALIEEPPPGPDTPRITAPTLVLWGTRDSIFDLESQRALADAIPGLKSIYYPDVGHAPNWEIPARVADDIAEFLAPAANTSGVRDGA
jgi:pimeloyl-ACP methyl ester carboxylesterase